MDRVDERPISMAPETPSFLREPPVKAMKPEPSPPGILGEQLDRAADAGIAGQGALRSAVHLDSFDIGEIQFRSRRGGMVYVVGIDRDRGRIGEARRFTLDDARVS
ncbi:MAG: hypothetical protein WDN24_18030 [Sphingomonas sp.]